MSGPFVFISHGRIKPGRLGDFKAYAEPFMSRVHAAHPSGTASFVARVRSSRRGIPHAARLTRSIGEAARFAATRGVRGP